MNSIKKIIKKSLPAPVFQKIYRLFFKKIKHPLQKFQSETNQNYVRFGSDYGGWTFIDDGCLEKSVIISAGLGEDASFDIEFASKYSCKIIIIDPTPRAIRHFKTLMANIGKKKSVEYTDNGKQPVDAYNLSTINSSQLIFIDKALWDKPTKLKFFSPPNPEHVSHSIINFQNNYRDDTSFIEVEATTILNILSDLKINPSEISLFKLDIEGAEIEVLNYCLENNFQPKQILVEFDELNSSSKKGFNRITQTHENLIKNGYRLVHTNNHSNFLYIRN